LLILTIHLMLHGVGEMKKVKISQEKI